MDASRYLRLKKEACAQTLARSKCIPSSLRTDMLAKAATQTFHTTHDAAPVCIYPCNTSKVAFGGNVTESIHPASACLANTMCADISDRYTTPFVVVPGCERPTEAPLYVSAHCTPCYHSTPAQVATAAAVCKSCP